METRPSTWLWLMLGVSLSFGATAGVYKWVDEQGQVHYGDRPQADSAQEMKLKAPPSSPPPDASRTVPKR